jgi:threonine/homoserine/homoserine lactone efflux protein
MNAKLKPLLEWVALVVCAVAVGLGLAWLPLEKSIVQLGLLLVGGALLAYVFYLVIQLSKLSDDDIDMSNWPDAPDDDQMPLEVKP